MSSIKYFVTGTDTEVGKTHISVGLLQGLKAQGLTTLGLKPIASGCEQTVHGLRNHDALQLQSHASIQLSYSQVNPYALLEPIAPHLAMQQQGIAVTANQVSAHCEQMITQYAPHVCVIEGAGGWWVPLNAQQSFADIAQQLAAQVILVVGMRLGCINHALLTYAAIRDSGLPIAGWVANCVDNTMLVQQANIETLQQRLPIPLLAKVDYGQSAAHVVQGIEKH
jgi:dethiobiotin synthetase